MGITLFFWVKYKFRRFSDKTITEFWILWVSKGIIKSWQGLRKKHTLKFAISKSVFHIRKINQSGSMLFCARLEKLNIFIRRSEKAPGKAFSSQSDFETEFHF